MGNNNSRFTPPFTERQILAFTQIAPKICSILSFVGIGCILWYGFREKSHLKRSYHRIVIAMSCYDLLWTVKNFVGTWPIPKEQAWTSPGASGNTATCSFVGFIGQVGSLGSVLYSGGLTLFFLLVIRYGWSEQKISRSVEPAIHAFCGVIAWGIGIAGLALKLYNPSRTFCGIREYPMGCTSTSEATPSKPANCLRGNNDGIYNWAFLWAWVWATFLFVACCMASIYHGLRRNETRAQRWNFSRRTNISEEMISSNTASSTNMQQGVGGTTMQQRQQQHHQRRQTNSRRFAVQAGLYVLFFFLTWVFATVTNSLGNFAGIVYYPLVLLSVIFMCLQGFFNAVIYLRPRWIAHCKKRRQQQQRKPCCCWRRNRNDSDNNNGIVNVLDGESATTRTSVIGNRDVAQSEQPERASEGSTKNNDDDKPDDQYVAPEMNPAAATGVNDGMDSDDLLSPSYLH